MEITCISSDIINRISEANPQGDRTQSEDTIGQWERSCLEKISENKFPIVQKAVSYNSKHQCSEQVERKLAQEI